MIFATDAQGDRYLESLGLDLGRLLAHRQEPWAIVAVGDEAVVIRFAHTPESAAELVANWMRAEDAGPLAGFSLEASVLAALKARQVQGQH